MYTCIHTSIHPYIHTCIPTSIHTYTHPSIHTYIHPSIYTYIHELGGKMAAEEKQRVNDALETLVSITEKT